MGNTVHRKFLYWLQICADDFLLLQMYPGWSARDNYAQTKETANNNSASFTLFLTFIFVQPFPKGFVSKEVYICVCRKRSENGRRHRTREVRLLIVVLLSKGRCRKLFKLQTISKSFTPHSFMRSWRFFLLCFASISLGKTSTEKNVSFGQLGPFFSDVKIQDLKVTCGEGREIY